ncbi:hypothetical protein ACTXT7_000868 [Hymenolepis weldensis]
MRVDDEDNCCCWPGIDRSIGQERAGETTCRHKLWLCVALYRLSLAAVCAFIVSPPRPLSHRPLASQQASRTLTLATLRGAVCGEKTTSTSLMCGFGCVIDKRQAERVVSIGHFIYAVGGYDSHSQLRSVERYNTEQNVWEYMTPMLHPRSALSASVLDGKIWVFGGYDGNEFLSSVEVYDPAQNAWVKTTVMPCGKSGHAVVTSREPVAAIASTSGSETSGSNANYCVLVGLEVGHVTKTTHSLVGIRFVGFEPKLSQ